MDTKYTVDACESKDLEGIHQGVDSAGPQFAATAETISRRISAEPRYGAVLYRIISFCEEERLLEEAEIRAQDFPEMKKAPHDSLTVIGWLVDAGALEVRVRPEQPEMAHEEEGILGEESETAMFVVSTPVAIEALRKHEEALRSIALPVDDDVYRAAFRLVLQTCAQPQSKKKIDALFSADESLSRLTALPSYFLDKLELAGALVWDDGWLTTDLGRQRLSEL